MLDMCMPATVTLCKLAGCGFILELQIFPTWLTSFGPSPKCGTSYCLGQRDQLWDCPARCRTAGRSATMFDIFNYSLELWCLARLGLIVFSATSSSTRWNGAIQELLLLYYYNVSGQPTGHTSWIMSTSAWICFSYLSHTTARKYLLLSLAESTMVPQHKLSAGTMPHRFVNALLSLGR